MAGLAASALDVEGETAWGIATDAGFGEGGEKLADGGEGPGVGGGVAAGGAPDGGLVDVDDLVDVVEASDGIVGTGAVLGAGYELGKALVEDLVDEAALAGAGNAGDAGEDTERNRGVDSLEVVLTGALDLEEAPSRQSGGAWEAGESGGGR